jgi:hypothetical protein
MLFTKSAAISAALRLATRASIQSSIELSRLGAIGLQPEVLPKTRTSAVDCTDPSVQEGTPQLGRQASRDGTVLCSWQLLSYAKATVTRQKEYVCEQLNRARFMTSAMPYSALD